VVWAESLQIVIQVREVNEGEGRSVLAFDPFGRVGNPAGDLVRSEFSTDASGRSPKCREGEFAQISFDLLADVDGVGVDVENFAAIGWIHGARSDRVIRGRIHVVPPKKFRAGEAGLFFAECIPNLGRGDETVRLFPELNFGQFAIVPAVGDDAVIRRRLTGEIIGLGGAGDCGESGANGREEIARDECVEFRGVRAKAGLAQTDDVDDCDSRIARHLFGIWKSGTHEKKILRIGPRF